MAEPIKVTVSDPATGEVLGEQTITDDYLLICAGSAQLTHTQANPGTGTHVLTIKGVHRIHPQQPRSPDGDHT